MQSLGELTTLYPSGGAFTKLADRFVDKAFGVAVGWNYFIIWFAVLANEYNAVTSILYFWSDKVPVWGYFLILWSAFLAFQLLGVESFGEAEFWLALIKLLGLTAYFLFAIMYVTISMQHASWTDRATLAMFLAVSRAQTPSASVIGMIQGPLWTASGA